MIVEIDLKVLTGWFRKYPTYLVWTIFGLAFMVVSLLTLLKIWSLPTDIGISLAVFALGMNLLLNVDSRYQSNKTEEMMVAILTCSRHEMEEWVRKAHLVHEGGQE